MNTVIKNPSVKICPRHVHGHNLNQTLLISSGQTKLIDLEELAKTQNKGKWGSDANQVPILSLFVPIGTYTVPCKATHLTIIIIYFSISEK